VAAAAAAPASSGQLTLAEAFDLLARAVVELTAPAPHEALRARMSALHGREDPLLDTGRFFKLLRQANDAEVADVKKLGEDNYEISPNPTQVKRLHAQQREAAALASSAARSAPATTATETAPTAATPPTGPVALRFRRGSRAPSRLGDLPLVGVVKVDDDAPAKPQADAAAGDGAAVGKKAATPKRAPRGAKSAAKSVPTPKAAKAAKAPKVAKAPKAATTKAPAKKAAARK
jgi:hypothetical protein